MYKWYIKINIKAGEYGLTEIASTSHKDAKITIAGDNKSASIELS